MYAEQHLPYLRELDLSYSKSLMRTPDFTGMPNLEYLDLSFCSNLKEVCHSLGNCKKLIRLNLFHCMSLERFPQVNVESLRYLDLTHCNSLEKFPEFLGRTKPEFKIDVKFCRFRELPSSVILYQTHITKLELICLQNLVALPSSIAKLKFLVELYVNGCLMLESLPEDIGDLENLEMLEASHTLISRPPPSIVRLNKLKFLSFTKVSFAKVPFVFPPIGKGLLRSLEHLHLRNCNLTDGVLLEDIGCLSSLKELDLSGNNFEHLPQSIAQLSALQSLNIGGCKSLTQLPKLPSELHELYADCQLALKSINNLVTMKKLQKVVFSPYYKDEAYNDSIYSLFAHTLFQNLSSLQRDISTSNSLSEREFTIGYHVGMFPIWFCYEIYSGYESVSVNLPENWYRCDSFLGFAICCSGNLFETTLQLTPLCNDEMSWMTQKLSYYSECDPEYVNEYEYECAVHFFFVPLDGLWDESKANGKTPNDYMYLTISGEMEKFGLRLLYKDEPELEAVSLLQMRKNNDDPTEHSDEEEQI